MYENLGFSNMSFAISLVDGTSAGVYTDEPIIALKKAKSSVE